jgi:putative endopeptidase
VLHVSKMLAFAGTPEAAAPRDARNILALETKLAEASLSRNDRRDPTIWTHTMSMQNISALVPGIDWPAFLKEMGMPPLSSVNVVSAHYLGDLAAVLHAVNETTIDAYLKWCLLDSIPGVDLASAFDTEDLNFDGHVLQGQQQLPPRAQRCLSATMNNLGDAVAQAFIVDNLPAASKTAVREIADDVVSALLIDFAQLSSFMPGIQLAPFLFFSFSARSSSIDLRGLLIHSANSSTPTNNSIPDSAKSLPSTDSAFYPQQTICTIGLCLTWDCRS